ncbi:alpha/beta hydrolase family protein [Adhaeribacter rhizoryzae]|uniref:Alpha/beta fold hydrolase n=1 Tax=Adhaeribacter rhizoryzae TaxID=2607907 RepID=A0A5M6DT94_9BACT|nr:alpha/beta fold hydrolase [Adhaeribacter rhizoryzae]KAA5549350.1 alpha/beta fold hydrolase [Adhaeribacter rhizoryzae]
MPAPLQRLDFTITPTHGRATRADARLQPNNLPKPVVIFIHGFKGFKEWGYFNLLADYFAEAGFVFIKLNLSHNGSTLTEDDVLDLEAFAQNNFSKELTDVSTLIDYLYTNKSAVPANEINLNQLFIIGHSRGGGLAILASAQDIRIKATATWAAISDLENRWPAQVIAKWKEEGVLHVENMRTKQLLPLYYQLVEDFLANKEKLSIPAAARHMTQPLLLIHGTHDETLPLQMAYDLKTNKPDAALEIITKCDHSFGGSHPYPHTTLPAAAQHAADKTISFFKAF